MNRNTFIGLFTVSLLCLSACNQPSSDPNQYYTTHRHAHNSIANAKLVRLKDGRVGFHSPDNDLLWYYIYMNNNSNTSNVTMPTSTRSFATFPSTNTVASVRSDLASGTDRIEAGKAPNEEELAEATSLDETVGELASDSGIVEETANSSETTSESGSSSSDSGSSSGDSGGE